MDIGTEIVDPGLGAHVVKRLRPGCWHTSATVLEADCCLAESNTPLYGRLT